jgi:hypothetical protein
MIDGGVHHVYRKIFFLVFVAFTARTIGNDSVHPRGCLVLLAQEIHQGGWENHALA